MVCPGFPRRSRSLADGEPAHAEHSPGDGHPNIGEDTKVLDGRKKHQDPPQQQQAENLKRPAGPIHDQPQAAWPPRRIRGPLQRWLPVARHTARFSQSASARGERADALLRPRADGGSSGEQSRNGRQPAALKQEQRSADGNRDVANLRLLDHAQNHHHIPVWEPFVSPDKDRILPAGTTVPCQSCWQFVELNR